MTDRTTSVPRHDDVRELNAAIDAVARRMTAMAPSANLRVRILASLDAPAPGRRGRPRWHWMVAAGGAVAMVIAVAAVRWLVTHQRPSTVAASASRAVTRSASAPDDVHDGTVHGDAAIAEHVALRARAGDAAPNDIDRAWRARELPALVSPAPLSIDRLDPVAPALPGLSIEPIDLPPIALSPLDPSGAGGRFD